MSIVAVFTLSALGHVHPTLPIVAELVRRGHRVVYYCGEAVRQKIEATGAEWRAVPWDFTPVERAPRPRLSAYALEQARCAETLLPQLLKELQDLNPACVMVDFMCFWGRIVARTLQLPTVNLSSSFALGPGVLPPRPVLMALDLAGAPLQGAREVLAVRRTTQRLSRQYRQADLRTQFDLLSMDGDDVLVCTARAFQPHAERFGERFQFVGPSVAPRAREATTDLPRLDERPLVYVSLGTVFNHKLDFFRECVHAFADGQYQVILSVGQSTDPAALGPLPPHMHARAYVPQLDVLARAAVFITHAGMNSVSEAMAHEVPVVAVPQAADQFTIAQRVAALGVGRNLLPFQRRARHLRAATDALVADAAVRSRCRALRQAFEQAGGPTRAAAVIEARMAGQA
ncbi:macrolide family glycosyltransferase [Deinococcus maricopensis]|uniref:Glycosyltransferase, MGT family n=1 Tax=Deinococcus maricopensis (strain DSM 21211 / LMG 22137 / NRRL B-23946 / LB-34) TaxID=709986 RepID=E8U984_DEIML|nr:macrolide family glycosyltransferase [Deinococcus maricopensis]ADV67623.1 glycosyltransferase, MGT family [Deinococcus maricopensis DSM 21211]